MAAGNIARYSTWRKLAAFHETTDTRKIERVRIRKTECRAAPSGQSRKQRAAFKLILATWVIENTGGPKVYIGRDMKTSDAHLSITANEFDIILHECKETFYQLGVPEKEMGELMAGLEAQRKAVVTAEAKK